MRSMIRLVQQYTPWLVDANVEQSPLSWRGHVTALDQWGPYDAEPT